MAELPAATATITPSLMTRWMASSIDCTMPLKPRLKLATAGVVPV